MNLQRIWHNVPQNTEEWMNLRLGLSTSSNFSKVYANLGKAFGDPAKKYAQKKALERVTGLLDDSANYSNGYMDRGTELEPVASMMYEEETLNSVENGGFFEFGKLGDSNDGNVGKDGCIEIKCVVANTHWNRIKKDNYDLAYKAQIQGHLYVGNKEWCDFVSYCPEFPEGKQLFIKRVLPDIEYRTELIERLEEFELLIEQNVKLIS